VQPQLAPDLVEQGADATGRLVDDGQSADDEEV
jgi:hypothetical protein